MIVFQAEHKIDIVLVKSGELLESSVKIVNFLCDLSLLSQKTFNFHCSDTQVAFVNTVPASSRLHSVAVLELFGAAKPAVPLCKSCVKHSLLQGGLF